VRTVLALGKSLGMPVLAEGIETIAQWQFLAREGCDKGQGYLFAKPVPLAKLPDAMQAAAQLTHTGEPDARAGRQKVSGYA
jgi:diguanylate cyclase